MQRRPLHWHKISYSKNNQNSFLLYRSIKINPPKFSKPYVVYRIQCFTNDGILLCQTDKYVFRLIRMRLFSLYIPVSSWDVDRYAIVYLGYNAVAVLSFFIHFSFVLLLSGWQLAGDISFWIRINWQATVKAVRAVERIFIYVAL